jgi:hypothetical protein
MRPVLTGWLGVMLVLPVATFARAEDPPQFLLTWGSLGSGSGQFSGPLGISTDNANVFVTDPLTYRVQKFTPMGEFVLQWGSRDSGVGEDGKLDSVRRIALSGSGEPRWDSRRLHSLRG